MIATTADTEAANEGTQKPFFYNKAKGFLGKGWIYEKGIDGDFLIEIAHTVTLTPTFFISDPPCCLKTLSEAVRGRDL